MHMMLSKWPRGWFAYGFSLLLSWFAWRSYKVTGFVARHRKLISAIKIRKTCHSIMIMNQWMTGGE